MDFCSAPSQVLSSFAHTLQFHMPFHCFQRRAALRHLPLGISLRFSNRSQWRGWPSIHPSPRQYHIWRRPCPFGYSWLIYRLATNTRQAIRFHSPKYLRFGPERIRAFSFLRGKSHRLKAQNSLILFLISWGERPGCSERQWTWLPGKQQRQESGKDVAAFKFLNPFVLAVRLLICLFCVVLQPFLELNSVSG